MYDDHYGLTGRPFQLTPDPRFWLDTATHKKAMAYLGYGLSQGEGFIVITGDPGVGKTTLVGHLMEKIDRTRLHVIRIASTQIEPDDLLRLVAEGMEIDTSALPKSELLTQIERALHAMARTGRRTLLIVDEAQALPVHSLEELRLLSNLQSGGHALLQIFLLGQPEFRERLQGSQRLEQLRQRVIALHHLEPMEPEEVEPYIIHRLALVGWRGKPRFTDDAIPALYRGSRGIPRQLNQLAGRVMLYGAIEKLDRIDAHAVEAVLADIAGDIPSPEAENPERPRAPEWLDHAPHEAQPAYRAPEPMPVYREPEPAYRAPTAPAPMSDADATARIAALEARLEEQDAALRRVLTLLVDWIEGRTPHPDVSSLRGFG